MKNKLFIPAIIAVFFFVASCRKEQEHIINSKTINVELKQNESYKYIIPPSGDAADVMEISLQPKHALTSKITADPARNTLLEYTPALDYTGSDEIHVNTVEGEHKDGGHHHGNCQGHGNDIETNYIFMINITGISDTKDHKK